MEYAVTVMPYRSGFLRRVLCIAVLTVTGFCVPAGIAVAQSLQESRSAYDEGRFLDAAGLAEALETSQGLAFATLALVTHGYYVAEANDKREFYERGMVLGERAVRLDPSDAESSLRWAQAMGRYAKSIGGMKAARLGYAGKIRGALETALALEPQMAMAHVALAAWHAEAIKVGGILAGAIFGASKKTAAQHYERAFELAPDSRLVLYEYARGLLILNKRKNREKARGVYSRVLELPSTTVPDGLLDAQVAKKLAQLSG